MNTSAEASDPISWQRLRAARAEAARRWPSPLRLPLVKRPTDVLYGLLEGGESVLDVGSGDATRRERIARRFPEVSYVSVDPDREAHADHVALDTVRASFDLAVSFEVLEHLPPEDGIALLTATRSKLRPGGRMIVSVPATHTPGRWLRDCTHVTPWAHDELGGALILAGFALESLHRSYPGPALRRVWRRTVLGPLGHMFGIDYAHSVIAVGRNDNGTSARGA